LLHCPSEKNLDFPADQHARASRVPWREKEIAQLPGTNMLVGRSVPDLGTERTSGVYMTEPSREGKSKRPRREKDRSEIDDNLRRVYEGMVDDDIPDRFVELLRKLRGNGAAE
jgi:hypothetical protein